LPKGSDKRRQRTATEVQQCIEAIVQRGLFRESFKTEKESSVGGEVFKDFRRMCGKRIAVEKIIGSNKEECKALEIKEKREDAEVQEKVIWKEIEEGGKRIIATYSERRAERDKKKREEEMRKAQVLVENIAQLKQKMKRSKGLKWIKLEGSDEMKYAIDKEKAEKMAKYDGWKGISTNSNMPAEEVIKRYRELFEVEHFFRAMKSELMIRPIYHWTPRRIRGHIAMCFVSLYVFELYQDKDRRELRSDKRRDKEHGSIGDKR